MPLFIVKKEYFDLYRFGKKDVELRIVKPQWKNSKVGDIQLFNVEETSLEKRSRKIYRGSLARIFKDVSYKRIFSEASNVFEVVNQQENLLLLNG